MFCPKCGARNADGAKFCTSCGAPLAARAAMPAGTNAGAANCSSQQPIPAGASCTPEIATSPKAAKRRRWAVPAIVAAGLVAVAFVLLRVVGVSVDNGPSSKGGMAVMDAIQIGPVSFGGVTMGNTGSNFATGARSVGDSKYDYFYSRDKGGICRAANDGSGMDVLQPIASDASCTIRNLNLDGDTLIYQSVVLDSSASSCIGTIHALKTDGTEDQEI